MTVRPLGDTGFHLTRWRRRRPRSGNFGAPLDRAGQKAKAITSWILDDLTIATRGGLVGSPVDGPEYGAGGVEIY